MALIHVPRPDPKTAMDPNRPVSSLLKMQILQLNDAEMRLPASRQTDIYINAIKTEGEAAEYIGKVTAAIHEAHEAAAAKRARLAIKKKPVIKRKPVIDIAAVADEKPARKRTKQGKAKKKKAKNKPGRKM
jgi:hypothetical protein